MEKRVPKNWVETDLDTIILKMTNGSSLKQEEESFEGSFPISRIETIWNETIDLDRVKYVEASQEDIEKYALQKGDVLFSHINSDKHLGKTAVFNLDQTIIHGINLLLLRAVPQYNGDLLNYILRHYRFSGKFIEVAQRSVNQSSINQKKLKSFVVPLPPLAEQQRIVAKLDEVFGHLDTLKAKLENIPQLIKNFRQAVLTQAVTGKLTEEWRKGKKLEDVNGLFKNIEIDRKKNKSKKVRDNKLNLRSDLQLFDIPAFWEWANLGFVLSDLYAFRYGVVQPGDHIEDEQKLIRVKDIKNDTIDIKSLRGISFDIDAKYKSAKVKEGDLLVSIVGTIGRTVIVAKNCEGYNIARAIAKLPVSKANSKFVKLFIDSENGQRWLIGDSREVARKTLNLEQLKTLPIPIPPKEEQTEIVKRVEVLFGKANTIEAQYQSLKTKIDSLPQAILAKAFKGELVEQLESDGSAEVLLEEIRKLKESLQVKKKSVKRKKKTTK